MVKRNDDEFRDIMNQMTDVPFRSELKSRVLQEIHQTSIDSIAPATKKSRRFPRVLSIISGLAAACAVVGIALSHIGHTGQNSTTATAGVPFNEQASSFGFQKSPLKISDVHIGTVKGDPKNSDVVAKLTNTSDKPVHESDVFGVLSFSPSGKPANDENWIDFVNGSNQVIQPGQTVLWWFNPSGAVLYAKGKPPIIETPHLAFYDSHLVRPKNADMVWARAPMNIEQVYVEPRDDGANMQSVQVDTTFKNTSDHMIDLNQERAVIWFSGDGDQSFLSSNSIRFLYHMLPTAADENWPTKIKPGQTVTVEFRVLSDQKADFFSRTPHVIIVQAPDSTGGK